MVTRTREHLPCEICKESRWSPRHGRAGVRRPCDRRRTRRPRDRGRSPGQLQPACLALGTADLRPGLSHARPGGRRARRRAGSVSARIPWPEGVQGPGEVLVVALPHHAEPLPRLDSARAPRADRRRCRKGPTRPTLADEQVAPTVSVEELVGRRQMSEAVAKAMAELPEEQRVAILPEGVSRPHVSGDRGHVALSVEHGEDAVIPGALCASAPVGAPAAGAGESPAGDVGGDVLEGLKAERLEGLEGRTQ